MRISYRLTAIAFLIVYVAPPIATSFFPSPPTPPAASTPSDPGTVTWDPCILWEQIPTLVRLSTVTLFISFLTVLIQGLRNRPAPRWAPILALLTLGPAINHQLWRVHACYSNVQTATFWISNSAIALLCIHHLLPRRPIPSLLKPAGPGPF
jgi:hypothetical protein